MASATAPPQLPPLLQSGFVKIHISFGMKNLIALDDGDTAGAFTKIDADANRGEEVVKTSGKSGIQHGPTWGGE